MIEFDVIEKLEYLSLIWSRKKGLLTALILLALSYISLTKAFGIEWDIKIHIIVVGVLCFLLWAAWIFTTNRYIVRLNSKDKIFVFLIAVDEIRAEKTLHDILNNTLDEIKNILDSDTFLKFKVIPTNYLKKKKDVDKYQINNAGKINSIVTLSAKCGTENKDYKIQLFNINYSVYLNPKDLVKNVFFGQVSIFKELHLRNDHKDWSYSANNSFRDKEKYGENLRDLILHLYGLLLISLEQYEAALDVMKLLMQKEKAVLEMDNTSGKIKATNASVNAARINMLLLELYFRIAHESYTKGNSKAAYQALAECEKEFPNNSFSFPQYIMLALFSYEDDNLPLSQSYTEKADGLKQNHPSVLLNKVFYSLISNDIYKLERHLKLLFKKRDKNTNNFVQTVSFLQKERVKYLNQKHLFDFLEAFYTCVFISDNDGRVLLNGFNNSYKDRTELKPLIVLANEALAAKPAKKGNKKRK